MGVQLVTDNMPACGLGIGRDDRLQMGQEIGLRARRSTSGGEQLSGDDIAAQDERAACHGARTQIRAARLCPEPGAILDACVPGPAPQSTHRYSPSVLPLAPAGCLLIQGADGFHRFFPVLIDRWGQPVADQMRLEIPFFNSRAACRGEICAMIPRAITSSAISRPVHWLIGRSFGCSQANAIIWQVCSAVICAGRPGRGASLSRSLTDRSSSDTACKSSQRLRHWRTVSTLTSSRVQSDDYSCPLRAAKIIRPRNASCCGVLCRRTSRSNSLCSSSLNVSVSGLGPRMGWILFRPVFRFQYTTDLFPPLCTSLVNGHSPAVYPTSCEM